MNPFQSSLLGNKSNDRDSSPIKVTVVAPIIGTSQQGKSSLIQFLHAYANQPVDTKANLIIGNGLTSTTPNVHRYSLRIPHRQVSLRRKVVRKPTPGSLALKEMIKKYEMGYNKEFDMKAISAEANDRFNRIFSNNNKSDELMMQKDQNKNLMPRVADLYDEGDSLEMLKAKLESLRLANKEEMLRRYDTQQVNNKKVMKMNTESLTSSSKMLDNDVLRLAKETLSMDAHEAELEGRDSDAKSLYELLAELELDSEYNKKNHTSSFSTANKAGLFKSELGNLGLGMNRQNNEQEWTLKDEHMEEKEEEEFESFADKVDDFLSDRTLELELTNVDMKAEPRLVLDVIDTPGLLDSSSLVDPMIDLEHLAMTLDKVRECKGNTSALVYVINANRPLDAANLTMLKTYLSTLGDFTRNLVVVHSGFDFRRAIRRTDTFGAKLNLFDLGPRATEFDRHLATTLGFPHIRAIHVPMNNDLSATLPMSPMRAGIRAMSYQAVSHLIDVLEQLAVEMPLVSDTTFELSSVPTNKMTMPVFSTMSSMKVPRVMSMDMTDIVKTKLVRDIDLLAESLVAKKLAMMRDEAMVLRLARDGEQLLLREKIAGARAELMNVEFALKKLDTDDLIEFDTKIATWAPVTTATMSFNESPFLWRMGASEFNPTRRGLFAGLNLLSSPFQGPSPVFAKISVTSTDFPIRSVREILPTGIPVAIRRRVMNPTEFELLLTSPLAFSSSLVSMTSTTKPIMAKLFTFRKDMYAKEIVALRNRRSLLRNNLAMFETQMAMHLADEAFDRKMQVLYRVLETLRGERMPLDLLLATKEMYRNVSRGLMVEMHQQQWPIRGNGVTLLPNMMQVEVIKPVLEKRPMILRDLDVLVGTMEKFFLGF